MFSWDDIEKWRKRNDPNAIILDPTTEKTYNVIKRDVKTYRKGKYHYLNVNRLPLELTAILVKGYPLVLYNDKETFLLTLYLLYPAAKKWQNVTCKILRTPLEYIEVLTEWQSLHPQTPANSTI